MGCHCCQRYDHRGCQSSHQPSLRYIKPFSGLITAKPLPAHCIVDLQAPILHTRNAVIRGATILVADDDEISARFLKRLLTREGHHVSVVQTAEEVLEVCGTAAPDLVLIDLVAPRGHGFDVCRRLKEQSSTRFVPVVIVTAQSDRADRLRGIEAGCD